MWKYEVDNNGDIVRWAETYIINSDCTKIKLTDLQKRILSNKSDRKIVLGPRRSGVTTAILIDILYNITHNDYRNVLILTDNTKNISDMLYKLTTSCMMPNGNRYIINWSYNNRRLRIDYDPRDPLDHNGRHSSIDIHNMSIMNTALLGQTNIDVYFDPCVIDSLPKIYDVLPVIYAMQVEGNKLWMCNTMSRIAPALYPTELNDLIQRRYEYNGFHKIIGDI